MSPHRRRGFEFDAMLRAVAARAGWHIPRSARSSALQRRRVAIIRRCSDVDAAERIAAELAESLAAAGQDIVPDATAASHVLVVLTGGVLEDEAALTQLQAAIATREGMPADGRPPLMTFVM